MTGYPYIPWFFGVWPGDQYGHYCRPAEGPSNLRYFTRIMDADVSLPREQKLQRQGHARLSYHTHDGAPWTCLCLWDKTEDHRGGSNAAFFVPGWVDRETLETASRKAFPAKWRALDAVGGIQLEEVDPCPAF